ncbi:unnamed protein product [Malus baccata var. baccata]
MAQPPGFVSTAHPSSYVCRLHKSLYGLKQAPRAWNEKFTSFLPGLGFKASFADPSLFSSGLFVSQSKYTQDLLHKVDMQDSKSCVTPCLPSHRLIKDDGKPYRHPDQYRSIVGALQYLTFTRPDIAFAVNQCCQFMQHPMECHVVAVKRILRYLSGTINYGIHFQPGTLTLQAYSDADWAGDPNDRRSTSGYVVYLGFSPISWASKKQHTVSRFSTEAEYRALAIAAAELSWIRQLLCDLQVPLFTAPLLYCDSISAIALSSNPVFHSRVKHLEIDYHFVRERVIRGDLHVQHVSSKEQCADILTKGLSNSLFVHHCSNLMLSSHKHELEGGCKDIKNSVQVSDGDTCQKIM